MRLDKFVLCADDFAISDAVSSAILDLINHSRISATSCLVTSRYWLQHAVQLRTCSNKVDIGLHLNLISDALLQNDFAYRSAFQPYPQHVHLILRSLLMRLDKSQITLEIERQLDRFVEGWGSLPDFIDGHLHVHQLPVVQEALIEAYKRHFTGHHCYIRSVANLIPGGNGQIKGIILRALGGRRLSRRLEAEGIPHNKMFGGIYKFSSDTNYREMMRTWLHGVGQTGLLMCHPGLPDSTGADRIGACRLQEYGYLSSGAFVSDCIEMGVRPDRYQALS